MKRGKIDSSTTPSSTCSSSSSHHPPSSEGDEVKRARSENVQNGSSGSAGTTSPYKVEDALECQVCLDVAVSPIYSCNEGGHVLCYICHGKLAVPKKCPSCSSQALQTNAALERQAQKLGYGIKCANAEAGCKEKVLSTDFKVHLETCYFRNITCLLSGCNRSTVKFNEFVAHRQQKHDTPIITQPAAGGIRISKIPTSINPPGTNSYWIIRFDNQFLLLRMNLNNSMCHIWMVIMGDDKEAAQYIAKISLFCKQKLPRNEAAYSWTVPVIPYYDDRPAEMEKDKPVFRSMSRKIFMSMVDAIDTFYSFNMIVEVIKME